MQRTYFLVLGAIVLHFVTTSSASLSIANNHNNSASDLNALLVFKAAIFDPQGSSQPTGPDLRVNSWYFCLVSNCDNLKTYVSEIESDHV